jgi:ankyrin repeat protein
MSVNNSYHPSVFNYYTHVENREAISSMESQMTQAIFSKDQDSLEKLLGSFTGNINDSITGNPNQTLLWYSLNEKNYPAAALLIEKGASLNQKLPVDLNAEMQNKFHNNFLTNKCYYGTNGFNLLKETLLSDYEENLAYALASHYYLQDPAALDFLLKYPDLLTLKILKVFIQLGDVTAFNKALELYLKRTNDIEKDKGDLLNYALADFHFCLMGFNFDYITQRLEIIKSILTLNPTTRTLNKHTLTSFEIAQYLKSFLPPKASANFEMVFAKIFEDPTLFHEIWGIQRLLINCLALTVSLPDNTKKIEIASYPSVTKHFQKSVHDFLQNNNTLDDLFFVTPSKEFTAEKCLKMIKEKNILKFFTGWTDGHDTGHAINGVIYDKYLFICNRGIGSTNKTSGVCIYEIRDENTLKKIVELFLERSKATKEFIVSDLLKHPQIKPLIQFFGKTQKVGNCVWLSEKMGVYACFIASHLKQGHSLEESTKLANTLYKQWSGFDRLNLLKAYLEHPYHTRDRIENKKEGILFKEMVENFLKRTPKRLKSKCCDLILARLDNTAIKTVLGLTYDPLVTNVRLERIKLALIEGDPSLALSMLNYFPDVNLENNYQETFLYLACLHNNLEFAKELIKRGADQNRVSLGGKAPLNALLNNHEKNQEGLTKFLIDITDLNELAKANCFPLHTAIKYGKEYAVQEILNKGFDINLPQNNGFTAFHYAAISKSESLCKYFLDRCPNVDVKTKDGRTPLYLAVQFNILHGVKILFDLGANPNVKTEKDLAPLNEIEVDSQLEVCRLLIANGADVNHKTELFSNYSPLMHMLDYSSYALVDLMLQSKDIDINFKSVAGVIKGESALTLAVKKGRVDVVKTLLEKGADPNICREDGETPLHIAVYYYYSDRKGLEISRLLLASGADKNSTSNIGQTPLKLASMYSNEEFVKLLS